MKKNYILLAVLLLTFTATSPLKSFDSINVGGKILKLGMDFLDIKQMFAEFGEVKLFHKDDTFSMYGVKSSEHGYHDTFLRFDPSDKLTEVEKQWHEYQTSDSRDMLAGIFRLVYENFPDGTKIDEVSAKVCCGGMNLVKVRCGKLRLYFGYYSGENKKREKELSVKTVLSDRPPEPTVEIDFDKSDKEHDHEHTHEVIHVGGD